MKIPTILSITGFLMMLPVIGLAQTSTVTSSETVTVSPAQITVTATSPSTKCGVNSFSVSNECGLGVYKNVSVQCYDGYETNLGASESSCKTADTWNQGAKAACTNHCSNGGGSDAVSTEVPTPVIYPGETTEGGNAYLPINPSTVPMVEREWVSVCTTFPMLAQNYNEIILELKIQESDKQNTEILTRDLENLKKYTEDAKKICSTDPKMAWQVGAPPKGVESKPATATESKQVVATTKPVEIPRTTPVCYVSDDLMQKYSQLIIELQKTESDKTRAEEITKQIIELRQQISTQQKKCVNTAPQQQTSKIIQPASTIPQFLTENKPVVVAVDRCNEVAQWETKIAYYKKLSSSSDDELKKSGFSREEIGKILRELSLGIAKVKVQCTSQEKTPVITRAATITGSAFIAETVKPVVIESGQEIGTYYKARL
ncbi:MAG: DUF6483 family protein [bacterium]|nr:DUF6483 family protein [bacterium]